VLVAVAVFSGVAVDVLFSALVAKGASVAVLMAAVAGALVGTLAGVAVVKLHVRMEANKTAIPN
jgi:NhaP-type Na+/H+ or K+/H+ antiporter